MDLRPYVEQLHHQLAIAAEAGGEDARALVERLAAPLDAAIRLTLQDVLSVAAEEITTELAPGSVEIRLRGRDPEFVVTPSQGVHEATGDVDEEPAGERAGSGVPPSPPDAHDGTVTRINLRLPEHLKSQIEDAAARDGLSVNAWLVRAAAAALDRTDLARRRERHAPRGAQRYTGWTR